MRTRLIAGWISGLALALAAISGNAGQNDQTPLPAQPANQSLAAAPASMASPAEPASSPTANVAATQAQPPAAPKAYVSPWYTEMLKLAQAHIPDSVMFSFVDSAGTFNLGAEQIVALRDAGVCDDVISAIMQHDFELAAGLRPLATTTTLPFQPALPVTLASAAVTTPTPEVNNHASGLVPMPADTAAPVPVEVTGTWVGPSYAFMPGIAVQRQAPAAQSSVYPVRQPYPVKLTQPILFVDTPVRTANLLLIQPFP